MAAAVDPISSVIGDHGPWQAQKIALVFLISIPGLAHIFCVIFSTANTDFWCQDVELTNGTRNFCFENCTAYEFDASLFYSTVQKTYGLVCDRAYLMVVSKMTIFVGYAVGTFVGGAVSDYFGRRAAMIFFSQMLFGAGIFCTIMPDVVSFAFVWFLVGIAAIAVFTVGIVWSMEVVSGKWKTIYGLVFAFTWSVARLVAALVSYLVSDWKVLFQVFAAFHLFTPIILNFVPESPRWLLSKQSKSKKKLAIAIMGEIAKRNDIDTPEIHKDCHNDELTNIPAADVDKLLTILKSPLMLKRALIMFFNWFVVSFVLYGLNLNWQALTGSIYLNLVIFSCLDFPAKVLGIFFVLRTGRRLPLVLLSASSGLLLFLMLAFEKGQYYKNWPIALFAITGAVCTSLAFSVLWIFTAELYPTNIRNSGIGASSLMARIGGVVATTVGILSEISPKIPPVLFGSLSLCSALLSLALPETFQHPLPRNLKVIEDRSEDDKRYTPLVQLKELF